MCNLLSLMHCFLNHCVRQPERICYIIAISPSSFTSLIRPSHTTFVDKDENPTLAFLTIFPSVPHFSGSVRALWCAYLCICLPPCCAQRSHQLDPVTDVCAVVGIWKGVQQQLMNAVRIPAALIHQRDEDVSHASRACQDQPWCRIANAFVHPLQRGTRCSDSQANSQTSSFPRHNFSNKHKQSIILISASRIPSSRLWLCLCK